LSSESNIQSYKANILLLISVSLNSNKSKADINSFLYIISAISNNSDSENEWTNFAGQRENDEQEEDFSFLNSETRQIVLAQNRTTHAIRAFVRFLFIQLSFTTFAGVLFVIASAASSTYSCSQYGECGVSTFFTVAAVLSIIIGIFVSSNAGWSELAKSSIPKRVK
jgi:hypothetical protein